MSDDGAAPSQGLWTTRIAALTDGIFAIVVIPLLYVRPARNTRHLTSLRPLQTSPQKD